MSTKSARHIERDGYHVIDWPRPRRGDLFISDLWQRFPELVVGRYLVNTCFDSGFLTLSDPQLKDGWHMVGRLAHSPKIRTTDQFPQDRFDEWLVFGQPIEIAGFETMVNTYTFSPIDFPWKERLQHYWVQVLRLQPLHVIAENDGVYLITRDQNLAAKILEHYMERTPSSGRF